MIDTLRYVNLAYQVVNLISISVILLNSLELFKPDFTTRYGLTFHSIKVTDWY